MAAAGTSNSRIDAPARAGANLLLSGTGLLALAGFAALFAWQRATYLHLLDFWSFGVLNAPFFDLDGPLAWLRCFRQGLDVFLETSCDLLGRPFNYSPLVLHLPLPWVSRDVVPMYGVLLDALYLLSLAVLPRPRVAADAVPVLLAAFSPFAMFGLERANLDLLMFAMVAAAVPCLQRGPAPRLLGYAMIMAAGLVKFYPWVLLLLLLLRERPRVFALGSAALLATVAALVGAYPTELGRVIENLPQVNPFRDGFGASQLPDGLVIVTHLRHAQMFLGDRIDVAIGWGCRLLLFAGALGGAVLLGRSEALVRALRRLSAREAECLTVGAAMMCGCFFIGANLGYRAVFVLFALPGLLALARLGEARWFARGLRAAVAAVVLVLWCLPAQRAINEWFGQFWAIAGEAPKPVLSPLPSLAFWVAREALWWCATTVLLAIVVRTVLDGRTWTDALRWANEPSRPAPGQA